MNKEDALKNYKEKSGYNKSCIEARKQTQKEFDDILLYLTNHPKIQPIWASEDELLQIVFNEYCFLEADVEILIKNSDINTKKLVHNVFDLTPRHINLLKKWIEKIPIDPPQCNYNNGIEIPEGNHRITLCDFLEISKIQIIVPADKVAEFVEKYKFKPIEK